MLELFLAQSCFWSYDLVVSDFFHSVNDSLKHRDQQVLWHPCAQMKDYEAFAPIHVVGAQGVWLELANGQRVLDAISSWWCKSLGHGHQAVLDAIQAQSRCFEHVILANTVQEGVVRLSERLLNAANGLPSKHWGKDCEPGALPGYFGKVFYADNGSTAIEIAMKMALHAQQHRGQLQRKQFVAFSNGYHGETVGAMSVSDLDWAASPYRDLCFPVFRLGDLPYRSGPNDPDWLSVDDEWLLIQTQLDQVKDTACAIVYEPILQAAGSMRLYSPELLCRLRAWADAHGVFLIADEIAAGMGRLGGMLATHLAAHGGEGANDRDPARSPLPDFACVSKGLTGGAMPLSAVLTTDIIYDLFYDDYATGKAFMHSNTYTGHALGVAAANAALDVYAADDVCGGVVRRGPGLLDRLTTLVGSLGVLTNPRGLGFVAAVDLVGPGGAQLAPADRTGYRVYQAAVERGALLRNLGDTMYLFPPLIASESELDQMVQILGEAVEAVLLKT